MTNDLNYPLMDTIYGRVTARASGSRGFSMETADGRQYDIELGDATSAEILRNLDERYADATDHIDDLITPGQELFTSGVFYPEADGNRYEAKHLLFVGRGPGDFTFEKANWWTKQIDAIAGFYLKAQFGGGPVDFREYRTILRLGGDKTDSHVQETDTISRLVYGMASAYMLTGKEEYLTVAERGTQYLRDHMRLLDPEADVVYWYHGIKVEGDAETKLLTSEFGDDYDAIPMYEQIYALAGPTQTFRVTGDRRIADDVDATLRLFERYFRDEVGGGYFSHIDPVLLSPHHKSLGANQSRKNWNSVGDHAPAYLINYLLATGDPRHATMLENVCDTIVERFPDFANSPFVNERFNADWSPDLKHSWQQNRAVVGHNLKIAWNLMRAHSYVPKRSYRELAEKLALSMPAVGSDRQRGGWYDVVERLRDESSSWHRFAWHNRKAWWQQEQAILAYLILNGTLGGATYEAEGRRAAGFYNAFFLDHDEGAVYFNVLADGMPYLLGTERFKGSHSMSMYHSAELCYLSAVYTNLLVKRDRLTLWFKPRPDASRTLRVAPDLLPDGRVQLDKVEIDGRPWEAFDRHAMTVELPRTADALTVRVELTGAGE